MGVNDAGQVTAEGPTPAIGELFARHRLELLALATLLGADDEAEDVVSEAFCRLQSHWSDLRDSAAARAWLRTVVCNLARARLRRLRVVRRQRAYGATDAPPADALALLREDQREVLDAVRQLPARQREALVLRYWLDLDQAGVAATMGISAGAVKSHTSRGMTTLARHLGARQ